MPSAPARRSSIPSSTDTVRRQFAAALARVLLAGPGLSWAAGTEGVTASAGTTGDGSARPPRGRIVLTVVSGEGGSRHEEPFDMARLDALPQHAYTTQTPWYSGPRRFSGPLLRDVLAAARAQGTLITAVALNDYKADIPYEDSQRHKMLVATRLDGKPMAVRDKGPLFIVYPYDESTDLRSERYYSRSVWQLRALNVR